MNKVTLKTGLVALVGMGLSANVSATDLTCDDITFSPEAFAAYEFVDKACLEIVDRNNSTYAKMTARVVAQTGGATTLRYRHADGEFGPSHKSNAPATFEAVIEGQAIKIKDLKVRQEVNVYIGPEFWVSNEVVEEIVEAAIIEEIIEEAIVEEIIEEEMEAELPTTAGPLPWLALFGSLFLILGGALRFSRKQ